VRRTGTLWRTRSGRSLLACPRDVDLAPVAAGGAPADRLTARCVPCADGVAWRRRGHVPAEVTA